MLGNDRFVIERRLGEGSMGAVYLAYDRVLRSRVALKTLRRVDASGIYLFKREFRALVDLVHPNLVRLHELFSQGDEWFFTMEYVRGRTFLDYVLGGTLRPTGPVSTRSGSGECVVSANDITDEYGDGLEMLFPSPVQDEERLRDVLLQITHGLTAVHEAGKLHRDLKPDNVMVTDEGRVVVLDFGVVIDRSHDARGTLEPTVFGTPAYMSPEQAGNRPMDVASDWYALGVMLFEALTGGLPFDGSYHEVLRSKQDLDPPRPSQMVSGVPPDLDELCHRLLSREPSARPDGAEIAAALRPRRPSAAAPPRPAPLAAPDFVGREQELNELAQALQATDGGQPAVYFVSGPSGIGKTTVVERFLQRAHHVHDAVVLSGRCYERESVPFKAVDSLIDSLCRFLRKLPPQQAAELLPRDVHPLCQLFPVMTRVEAFAQPPPRLRRFFEPQQMRRRAFSALRELLARLADRYRLTLFIDDLQWGDMDSAWLLRELLRGPDAPALLLVCAYRDDGLHQSDCVSCLRRYAEESVVHVGHLEVGPLSVEESRWLLRSLEPEAGAWKGNVAALQRDAGGNPHLLTELLHYALDRPEDSLPTYDALLRTRINGISEQARTLLRLVAVAGRPVPEEVLSLSATFDINMQDSLLALRAQKLVRGVALRDERAVEVYHNRIREVVLAGITEEALRRWHRRLATTLEATGSSDLEALVAHLMAAGEPARAGLYALRAAEQAAASLAFDKASRLYAIAASHATLGHAERHELLMSWAETLESAGRGAEAGALYLEASKTSDPTEAAVLRQQAGVQLLSVGELERGTQVLRDALHRVGLELSLNRSDAMERTAVLRSQLLRSDITPQLRDASEVPSEVLQRLDLTWAVAHALLVHDTVRAIPLLHRFAVEAVEAGERHRIVKGLAYCDALSPLIVPQREGGPAVDGLALAEKLLESDAPAEVKACVLFARGMRALNHADAATGLSKLQAADQGFGVAGTGLSAPGRLCRVALVAVESVTGQGRDPEQVQRYEHEALATGDHLLAGKLELLSGLTALRQDDPMRVVELCDHADLAHGEDDEIALMSRWLLGSALALYRADRESCREYVVKFKELASSLLLSIRFFNAHTFSMLARLRLMVAGTAPAQETLARAELDLQQAEACGVASLGPLLTVARAALAELRQDSALATQLLNAAAGGPDDLVQATARYVLQRGRSNADAPLRERGIVEPSAFARLVYPVA